MEEQPLRVNQQDYDRLVTRLALIFEKYGFSTCESAQMAAEALTKIEPIKKPKGTWVF